MSEGGSDTSSVPKLAESLSVIVETLNSASKGKSKGRGKKGQWTQESSTGGQWQGTSQNVAGNRQPWKEAGRALERPKEKCKGKGKEERPQMLRVRRDWTPREVVPSSEGWVHDLEQDAPEGEDTNEGECWTEEDDETLLLGYLGSESCQ